MLDFILTLLKEYGLATTVAVVSMIREWRTAKKLIQVQDSRVEDTKAVIDALSDHKESVIKMNLILDRIIKNGNEHDSKEKDT